MVDLHVDWESRDKVEVVVARSEVGRRMTDK